MQELMPNGDLNSLLSKSRLKLRIDDFFDSLFKLKVSQSKEQWIAQITGFCDEIQSFRNPDEERKYLTDRFNSEFEVHCRETYAKLLDE